MSSANPPAVAIIGAGLAGLACAARLTAHGASVRLFDKANRAGGRMSTRLHAGPFDHGAQYFTARDDRFRSAVLGWELDGVVQPWHGRFAEIRDGRATTLDPGEPRWVGVPTMGDLPVRLARDLEVAVGTRIATIEGTKGRYGLVAEDGRRFGPFATVVVAVPPAQAEPLLSVAPALAARIRNAEVAPCWACMLRFDEPLALPYDGATVDDDGVAWVARDDDKPGRPEAHRWVLHATEAWTRSHLEIEREDAERLLAEAFRRITGATTAPAEVRAHRWRYARVTHPVGETFGWDRALAIGSCGDAWIDGRVEAAWVSGDRLAAAMLDDTPPG